MVDTASVLVERDTVFDGDAHGEGVAGDWGSGSNSSPSIPPRRGKDVVLTLAGIAGLLSIVWFVFTAMTGTSIIVFATGSMAPTMPTGSAALVHTVQASDIQVGHVVTVQRPGSPLPVTHRVVSVAADPDSEGSRVLVLRGDANSTNDPFPYRVSEAQQVLISVPFLGTVLAAMNRPIAIGFVTVGVALFVVWAFWPGRRAAHRGEARNPT